MGHLLPIVRPTTLIGLVLAACAAPQPAVIPDETSAEAHRREAERERTLAALDAPATDRRVPEPTSPLGRGPVPYVYVPGEPPLALELDPARTVARHRHMTHALEHERAARALETFEAEACREVPMAERAACPVLMGVARVEDLTDGVRIHFEAGVDATTVLDRMRCHLAYARARGFPTDLECPLYLRGVHIERARKVAGAVDVRGATPSVAATVRRHGHYVEPR